ncbi:hypothetical protein Tco_1138801 [Tanacetum coccineum]
MLSVLEKLQEPAVDKNEDMSIEEIEHEKLRINDEIKDITNDLGIKRFQGEKIDDEYERDCEIKIKQLLKDYAGLDIEMRKKERALMEEKYLANRDLTLSQCLKSCYDDDKDDKDSIQVKDYYLSITITPVLSTEEPVDSLNIGDGHLSTIPATESDEVIKSSVEVLVLIPSESEGIPNITCDVPFYDDFSPLDISNDNFEIFSDVNDEVNDFGEIEDDILREKILKINLLISKIESLNNNPTPSTNFELKSPSFPISDEDSDFLPELESFRFDIEEKNSGSTTIHADISLLDFNYFSFEIEPDMGTLTTKVVGDIVEHYVLVPNILPTQPTHDQRTFMNNLVIVDPGIRETLFTYVVRTFLPFLTYPVPSLFLISSRSEDTIFDPGISMYHSFMLVSFASP